MDGVIVSRSEDSQFRFCLRHNMSLPNPTKPPSGTHLTRPPRGYLEKRSSLPKHYFIWIFKRSFSMTGAISQDRESCQFLSWLMKNPILDRAARPESGQDARETSFIQLLARTQSEQHRRLALCKRFSAPQIVWTRSPRRVGARGGAWVGGSRWLRILTITAGPSMPVLTLSKGRR